MNYTVVLKQNTSGSAILPVGPLAHEAMRRRPAGEIGGGNQNVIDVTSAGGPIGTNGVFVGDHNFICGESIFSGIAAGGRNMVECGYASFIGGGDWNCIHPSGGSYTLYRSFIGGGFENCVQSNNSVIAGGITNSILTSNADAAVIAGGANNTVNAPCGAVLGGAGNTVPTLMLLCLVIALIP